MHCALKMSVLGVFLSTLALPFCLHTQTSWSGGLAVGANLSTVNSDPEIWETSLKPGYSSGIRIAYHPDNQLAIQAEVLMERKGSLVNLTLTDAEGNPVIQDENVKNNFDYLVFPLTVHWRFGEGKFRYGPYAGAYVAALLKQKTVLGFETGGLEPEDITDSLNQTDAGAIAGFGAEWKLTESLSFSLEGRYSLGVVSYTNSHAGFEDTRNTHQSMAVLTGLRFFFGQ